MRKMFFEYYPPTEIELKNLWDSCIFVLDANVLLNAYRYSSDTVEELFGILEHKFMSARLWIPYQAAVEYQRNRLTVIDEQKAVYGKIRNDIHEKFRVLGGTLNQAARHPLISTSEIADRLDKTSKEILELLDAWESKHPDHMASDHLRTRWTNLLDTKVGNQFDDSRLQKIVQEGRTRHDNKTPPGYMDASKSEDRKYGDLILWFQIIEKSIEEQKPVILVTDDAKEDWWLIHHGKTISPRPELLREFYDKTQQQISIYRTAQFMRFAQEYLGKDVAQDAISEIESISLEQEARLSSSLPWLSSGSQHDEDPILKNLLATRKDLIDELRFLSEEISSMASFAESPRYTSEFLDSEDGRAFNNLYRELRIRRQDVAADIQRLKNEVVEYRVQKDGEINARQILERGRLTAQQNKVIREIIIKFARIPSYVKVFNMRTADIDVIIFNLVQRLKEMGNSQLIDFLVESGVIEAGTHRLLLPEIIESILILDREKIEIWYVTPRPNTLMPLG